MAAKVDESHRRRWAAMGLRMIEPAEGVRMLGAMLRDNRAAQLAAIPMDRARLPAQGGAFLNGLRVTASARAAAPAPRVVDMRRLLEEADAARRPAILLEYLAGQLVQVLALGEGAPVDTRRSIMEMGLDSLMAMELRNRLHAAFGVKVSVPQLLRGPSLAELGATLLESLERRGDEAPAGTEAPASPGPAWEEGSL